MLSQGAGNARASWLLGPTYHTATAVTCTPPLVSPTPHSHTVDRHYATDVTSNDQSKQSIIVGPHASFARSCRDSHQDFRRHHENDLLVSTVQHTVDTRIVALKDKNGHVKYGGFKCHAVGCKFGHGDSKPIRKDKLTQHIRDMHQGRGAKFRCLIVECPVDSLSLKELIFHLEDTGLYNDVRFSALVAAAERPKCVCGEGLVIHGRCKACNSIATFV
jgi:hypothetical protein